MVRIREGAAEEYPCSAAPLCRFNLCVWGAGDSSAVAVRNLECPDGYLLLRRILQSIQSTRQNNHQKKREIENLTFPTINIPYMYSFCEWMWETEEWNILKVNKWLERDSVDPAGTVCHELPLKLFPELLSYNLPSQAPRPCIKYHMLEVSLFWEHLSGSVTSLPSLLTLKVFK